MRWECLLPASIEFAPVSWTPAHLCSRSGVAACLGRGVTVWASFSRASLSRTEFLPPELGPVIGQPRSALLHMSVRPSEIYGRAVSHPPAFLGCRGVVVFHGDKHALQLCGPEAEAVNPFSIAPVVVDRATPTFGRRLLDRGIAHLALDLDDQAAGILQLDHKIRQVLPERSFLAVGDDQPEPVILPRPLPTDVNPAARPPAAPNRSRTPLH